MSPVTAATLVLTLLATPGWSGAQDSRPAGKPAPVAPDRRAPSPPRQRRSESTQTWLRRVRVDVHWKEATLDEALDDLALKLDRSVVRAPVLRDHDSEPLSINLERVSATSALKLAQSHFRVRFLISDGMLLATTVEDAVRRTAVLKTYDLRSILYRPPSFPAPRRFGLRPSGFERQEREPEVPSSYQDAADIAELIRNATRESDWSHESVSIDPYRQLLVVKHTPTMHRKIASILRGLRAF